MNKPKQNVLLESLARTEYPALHPLMRMMPYLGGIFVLLSVAYLLYLLAFDRSRFEDLLPSVGVIIALGCVMALTALPARLGISLRRNYLGQRTAER